MRATLIVALIAAGLLSAPLAAQTINPGAEANALFKAQEAAVSALPSSTPSATIVPGYAGDASSLHGYVDNGARLSSDGQAAVPGNEYFATASQAADNAGGVTVSNNDAWIQRSLAVTNDPADYTGGAQGEDSTSCSTTTTTEADTTQTLYTCESGNRVTEDSGSCTRTFNPDTSGSTGQIGWSQYVCQEGYRDDPGTRTCDVPLVVTNSTQYKYECELLTYCDNGWNQESVRCGQFLRAGCTRTGTYKKTLPRQPCHLVFQYTCPRAVTDTPNNETKIWNKGTVPGTTTAIWDETACQALATDSTCTLQSETCIEGAGTRVISGVSVYQSCWKKRRTYSCSSITQGAGCNPPAGSQFLSQRCLWSDRFGVCRLFEKTYRYVTSVSGPSGSWVYESACAYAGDPNCSEGGTTCLEGPSTRTIDGVAVTADCWRQRVSFQCTRLSGAGSDCNVQPGCTWKEDRCLDENPPASGCQTVEHVYSCSSSKTSTTKSTTCGSQICVGAQCYTLTDQTSSDLPAAFASVAVAEEAGEDYAAGITIFKGEAMRCRKAVLGFRNCCKDSGWGLDLGLAQCDEQEKLLIEKQKAKACHYVGSWCSKDTPFGCAEKSMRYCCFEGALGRIVQEAGHKQLAKSWGTAKGPDCSGFTVEQFQQLDLSQVDFSDFTKEAMKKLKIPNENGTVQQLENSLKQLYDSGTPGTGG